ncbi:MAG: DUF4397 domain-containing protein [Chitinophagaceae bacterium]|nr:DUF4397 domain-containing protein [Chitinophagaceae bacterium]
MKFVKSILFICCCGIIAASCTRGNLLDENIQWQQVDPGKAANIKLIQNFAGNTPQLPTAANLTTGPQLFLYANGKKVTGNAVGYAGIFPATTVYASIEPGTNIRFDLIMARMNLTVVPNVPAFNGGDTLATFNQTLEAGKFYSFMVGDTVPTIRVTVIEDDLTAPAYQTYKIRLANWVMNPGDTLSLYSRREKKEIIQDVAHKKASDWVQLPLPIISDTLELRKKGSQTIYVTVGGTAPTFTPTGMRMYTVVARGKTGVTAKIPSASIFTNR